MSSVQPLLDAAGRRRSPATTPGARRDSPAQQLVAVMRQAAHTRDGHRLNALIVVLWRAGLRIQEALSLIETDLDQRRGSIPVRHGRTIAGARSAWMPGHGQ